MPLSETAKIHLRHLCEERAIVAAARDEADTKVRALNKQIFDCLVENGTRRDQLMDGTVVQIIEPKPRQVILGEKLLTLGVDPDVIKAATKETPVDPYVKVFKAGPGQAPTVEDAPKTAGESTAIN